MVKNETEIATDAKAVKRILLEKEINSIRRGHLTGGYCDTDLLKEKEKQLLPMLREELAAYEKHDSVAARAMVALVRKEILALSYKPAMKEVTDAH